MTSTMTILMATLKHRWKAAIALLFTVLLAALLEAAPPFVLTRLVDRHLEPGIYQGVWLLALLYLLAIILTRAVSFAQTYISTVVGQEVLHRLRLALSQHLSRLPIAYFDANPVGEIMSRITSDVESINTLFTSGLINIIADSLRIVGITGAMIALSPRLTIYTLLTVPVVALVTENFRRVIYDSERKTRRAVGLINSDFQETLRGIRVIHSYDQRDRAVRRLGTHLSQFLSAASRAILVNSFFPPTMDVIKAALTCLLIWGGTALVSQPERVSIGVLVAFAQMVNRLFTPLTALSDEYQTIQRAAAGVDRINEVLSTAVEERPLPVALPRELHGRVEMSDVSFGYVDGHAVIRSVNLVIPAMQRVAIVGRTGGGKSTLLSLLTGVYAPWQGNITIDGIDPRRVSPSERRRLIGVVPQTIHLTGETLREVISAGDSSVTDEDIGRALMLVGLWDALASLPNALDTPVGTGAPVGTGGLNFSHGQKQLLSLARALALNPAVLLLDEPSSGLDAVTEARLFNAIGNESKKRTTITVSHRVSGALDADRIIVIGNGQVVQDGTRDELQRQEGFYSHMVALETLGWKDATIGS